MGVVTMIERYKGVKYQCVECTEPVLCTYLGIFT
jgi:hypothetical protein